jgi:hypothetical protein
MRKLQEKKNFKLLLLMCFTISINFWSCTKIDINKNSDSKDKIKNVNDFFKIPQNTEPMVLRVIDEIKNRNNKKEFISSFANEIGFPVWDKAIITITNGVSNNLNFANSSTPIDTFVYIPFVIDNSISINGYILAKINTNIGLSYTLSQDYKLCSFEINSGDLNEASKLALRMMYLNKSVFDVSNYKITDTRLLSEDTVNKKIISVNLDNTISTQNNFVSSISCSITVTTTSSCMRACPVTISSSMFCTNEWPSGNPTEGGGGGGGSIPPNFPCSTNPNPSLTGQSNTGSNSVLPGGPLPPCPTPGSGWIPLQGTNANGYYYSRMASLDSMLNINPYAAVPCDSLIILNTFGQMFQSVGNYRVPFSVQNRLDSIKNATPNFDTSSLFIQSLNNASGSVVNCDFFPLKINLLPIKDSLTGIRFTGSEFLEFFRKNISFFSTPNVTFEPYNSGGFNDIVQNNKDSINSLGAVMHIDMDQDGSVIVSGYQNAYSPSNYQSHNFIFSTIVNPLDGYHPVSGNRKFGIYTDTSGGFTFYTMGVDRISRNDFALGNWVMDLFGPSGFEKADNLWSGMQDNVINYINSHQGSALNYSRRNYKIRPDWDDIEDFLNGTISLQELKNKLCP